MRSIPAAPATHFAVVLLVFAGLVLATPSHGQSDEGGKSGSLRAALDSLAAKHDIAVQGLETVNDEPAPAVGGTPLRRI